MPKPSDPENPPNNTHKPPNAIARRNLDELTGVALTATYGHWSRCAANNGDCPCRTIWSVAFDVSLFCLAPSDPSEAVTIQDWNFVATFDPPTVLTLLTIARTAQAVRNAHRNGLRGDYVQDVHDKLAEALDAAGLSDSPHEAAPASGTIASLAADMVAAGGTLPYPGSLADISATPTDGVPNPQPDDRDLILEVIHDLDRRVLQAQADGNPHGRDIEREQSEALRRLLKRADDFLGWRAPAARVGRST